MNIRAFYNDIDPYCCAWLSNLMDARLITPGVVDDRSIHEITPDVVSGFQRVHFFAGIAGWDLALNIAGWGSQKIWTGSCPCQPLSSAGKQRGHEDERHLWPAFHSLIAKCRPAVVFGEQVASADGREWLAGVRADLEALGYACGAADLCAAGVSAPHPRQRLYWVGVSDRDGPQARHPATQAVGYRSASDTAGWPHPSRMVNANGYHKHWWSGPVQVGWNGCEAEIERGGRKYRAQWRLKPGLSIVAHGVPGRVGKLRAAGNAIVPQLAAEFIAAFMEAA